MERAEAEAIHELGRETVVAVLLELSSQNALLSLGGVGGHPQPGDFIVARYTARKRA